MWDFLVKVNQKHGLNLGTYKDLYQWSIENVSLSWGEIWEYVGIRASAPYDHVLSDEKRMFPRPAWFPGARLNFAENLLFPTGDVDENTPAVIAATETTRETITWKELRNRVKQCQSGMQALRIKPGDRVAGYVANHVNALVAMIAAASLGASWTAVSPDTGVTAVLDRLVQIEPTILFTDNAVIYNGKTYPVIPKVKEIAASLPSLSGLVIFETVTTLASTIADPDEDMRVGVTIPIFIAGFSDYWTAFKAARQHQSQLVWFRWLYITFSRYMWVNEWIEEDL